MSYYHVSVDQNHMDTTFEIKVSCPETRIKAAERLLDSIHLLIHELENELSEFVTNSSISLLNSAPAEKKVQLTESALELLLMSERVRSLTHGCFDCTAKSPGGSASSRFAYDLTTKTAWRLSSDVKIGFGGIGKGYALDCARAMLEKAGFTDYLLNAGGTSILLSGFSGPQKPWTWAWSWKKDAQRNSLGSVFTHSSGQPIALGVSGTHEKGNHIVDPTKKDSVSPEAPWTSDYKSTVVAHPSAALADALSTAFFVGGWRHAEKWSEKSAQPMALATIDQSEVPEWNVLFEKFWKGSLVF